MTDARYRSPWEVPDCPGCGGHIFVGRASNAAQRADGDWHCHGCGATFEGEPPKRASQAHVDARRIGEDRRLVADGGREKRCVWCGLPKFGDNRCVCDNPRFEFLEECDSCGEFTDPDKLFTHESLDRRICRACSVVTDGGHYHPRDSAVPVSEAVGYLHLATDQDLDPVPGDGYWIPVGEQRLVERSHPPRGHIIQYPKDDREPRRVGDKEVPDHVFNWDERSQDGDPE